MTKQSDIQWENEFYKGLMLIERDTFPKTCRTCGRTYETLEDFMTETDQVDHPSGLMEFITGDVDMGVGLFRNCVCESTLMSNFKNRRDTSKEGKAHREEFEKLMGMLETKGMRTEKARKTLLSILGD